MTDLGANLTKRPQPKDEIITFDYSENYYPVIADNQTTPQKKSRRSKSSIFAAFSSSKKSAEKLPNPVARKQKFLAKRPPGLKVPYHGYTAKIKPLPDLLPLTRGTPETSDSSGRDSTLDPKNAINALEMIKQRSADKGIKASDDICRICLDSQETQDTGRLISPCKCTGTVKCLHEECLKKWILSLNIPMEEAHCELCSEKFHMILKKKRVFSPETLRRSGWQNVVFSLFLMALLYILITLIVYFIKSLVSSDPIKNPSESVENTELYILKWFVIIICTACAVILTFSIFFIWRDACCKVVSTQWTILDANQDIQTQPNIVVVGETNYNNLNNVKTSTNNSNNNSNNNTNNHEELHHDIQLQNISLEKKELDKHFCIIAETS